MLSLLESSHPVWHIQNVVSEISVTSSAVFMRAMVLVLTVMCCVTHVLVNMTEIRVSYLMTDADICMLLKE